MSQTPYAFNDTTETIAPRSDMSIERNASN